MISTKGLPLFDWAYPGEVVSFPSSHRIGEARIIAQRFVHYQTTSRIDACMQTLDAAESERLKALGLSGDEIDAEIRSFFQAIWGEYANIIARQKSGNVPI